MARKGDAVQPPRRGHYGQPRGGMEGDARGRTSRILTVDDAMSYLGELRDAFRDQPEKYNKFQELMIDFKTQRIDTGSVMARAKELFTGYDRLIHGFNTFLPEGYQIAPDGPRNLVSCEEATDFLLKVKECFWSEENVYLSFVDAVTSYRHGIYPIRAVYNEVAGLFAGQPDLIEEFKSFLPESFQDQESFQEEEELSCITTLTSDSSQMEWTEPTEIGLPILKNRMKLP